MKGYASLSQGFKTAINWLGGLEPVVLLVALVMSMAAWGFVELAGEVKEGDTQAFDEYVVRSMRHPDNLAEPIGPPWMKEVGRDVTAFGGYAALVFFLVTIAGYLWLDRKHRLMVFLLAASTSGFLVSMLLKRVFSRARPDIVPHLSYVYTSSFPSGHSMMSAVIYLTLGAILATALPHLRLKIYVLSVAIALTILVGISRVYLGVHYPTDVLAGWMVGLLWALLCWSLARWLQRRGQVEDEQETVPPDSP